MKVDSAVIDKLRKARDTASVVCANPTSIKSFYLKFIEIMHYIDQTVVSAKMDKQLEASKSLFSRFKVRMLCDQCRMFIAAGSVVFVFDSRRLVFTRGEMNGLLGIIFFESARHEEAD